MSKFKVGDEVRIVNQFWGHGFKIGEVVRIKCSRASDYEAVKLDGSNAWYVRDDELELINKKTIMQTINTLAKKLLDSNTKTLIKAGFLDESLNITTEGQAQLNAVIFEANKEALVKAAEEKIAEEKK